MTRTLGKALVSVAVLCVFASCQTGPSSTRRGRDDHIAPGFSGARGDKYMRVRRETVDAHLEGMSLDERIAERFVVFVPQSFTLDDAENRAAFLSDLERLRPGGLILYPWNYDSSHEVQEMTSLFQETVEREAPGRRLLLCADQEGGRVMAFRFPDIVQLPSAYRVGRHGDPRFVESAAYLNATELRDLGINMNLAPVLDVTDIPDRGIIGDRSMGGDPNVVSELGAAYIAAFRHAGVIATAKHFPGHGVTTVDSHGRLPIVDYDMDSLRERDLKPFATAIDHGVPVVMTAHILFPGIDPEYPVTLSEVFVQDLLRDELGFEGVVISDGLEMGALAANYDLDTTLERAFRYGVDLVLLYTRYDLSETIERVRRLVDRGALTEGEIDAGVRRILELKFDYGLLDEVP